MKKLTILIALMLTIAAQAQTLNVVTGSVTYQFPAAQTGPMNYADGTTLTVMGKVFQLTDITRMYVDNTEVTDNEVSVSYDGTTARVTVAGNVAQYVEPAVNGTHVSIVQSADVGDDNVGEITYSLSGTSDDGELTLSGSYKTTIELHGLSLTNPSGAAIDIQNGKRVAISIKKDTENTLREGSSGGEKASLVAKGHTKLKGEGTLDSYR